jgi:hypothetical protein
MCDGGITQSRIAVDAATITIVPDVPSPASSDYVSEAEDIELALKDSNNVANMCGLPSEHRAHLQSDTSAQGEAAFNGDLHINRLGLYHVMGRHTIYF